MANLERKMRRMKLWMKENGFEYLHFFVFVLISSALIISNKLVLSPEHRNFAYPRGLGLLQMGFSSALFFITMKVMKIRKIKDPGIWNAQGMSRTECIVLILKIGATFAGSLYIRNDAYSYFSVAFTQVLKTTRKFRILNSFDIISKIPSSDIPSKQGSMFWSITDDYLDVILLSNAVPLAIFVLGMITRSQPITSWKMLSCMSTVSIGVIAASYGEPSFSWYQAVYQIGSVVPVAARLYFMEKIVRREGRPLNSVSAMYYTSLCSSLCLFLLWIYYEMPKIYYLSPWDWDFSLLCILCVNCLTMFALNLQVCLVIPLMKPLTFAWAKIIRDLVVVFLSYFLFADVRLTTTSIFGYLLAFLSLVAYYHLMEKALIEDERVQALENATSRRRMPPSRVSLEKKAGVRLQVLLGDVH